MPTNKAVNVSVSPVDLVNEWLSQEGQAVIQGLYRDFDTSMFMARFDGVDKKLNLAALQVATGLITDYSSDFQGKSDVFNISGLELNVGLKKMELIFVLNDEAERAFAAYLLGKGASFDSESIIPYLLQPYFAQIKEELNDAIWQAVDNGTPAANRPLLDSFDGITRIAKNAGTAGTATVVPTGALTNSNARQKFTDIYNAADKKLKAKGMYIYTTYEAFDKYRQNCLALNIDVRTTQIQGSTYEMIKMDVSNGNTYIVPVVGMGDGDKIIASRPEWLAYGYNSKRTLGNLKPQERGWETWLLGTLTIGVQILMQRAGMLIVNDQL